MNRTDAVTRLMLRNLEQTLIALEARPNANVAQMVAIRKEMRDVANGK